MKDFPLFFHKNSGDIARERIRGVILSDRLNCTPETAEKIKKDITEVLSKYLELENVTVKIHLDISEKLGQGVEDVKTIQIKGL